jgi:hypothetical protein
VNFLRSRKSPPPANRDLEKDEIIELLVGTPGNESDPRGAPTAEEDPDSAFESEAQRRQAWAAHREELLPGKPAHVDAYWAEERYGSSVVPPAR